MNQSFAIWFLIGAALITSNLPFVWERPLVALPWRQAGEPPRSLWKQMLVSAIFFAVLAGIAWLTVPLIGQAYFMAGDMASVALFIGKLVLVLGMMVVVLAYAGWRNKRSDGFRKSFLARLIEMLVLYALLGVLSVAFETNIGNPFPKNWEFIVITLSLYLVLGYPGFVYRYLMKRRKPAARRAAG